MERLDGVADALIVAADAIGDAPGVLATHAGQEDLVAAPYKGIARL
jgi:hypothetical protein